MIQSLMNIYLTNFEFFMIYLKLSIINKIDILFNFIQLNDLVNF